MILQVAIAFGVCFAGGLLTHAWSYNRGRQFEAREWARMRFKLLSHGALLVDMNLAQLRAQGGRVGGVECGARLELADATDPLAVDPESL